MTNVNNYLWPADLPEGCPPEDAKPGSGWFFRFVNKNPVTAKDFIRPIDRPNADYADDERCSASALSLFADADDVTLAQKLVPGFKKRKVAQGELTPRMGVIKNTPMNVDGTRFTSHYDWWVAADYTDLPSFAVVAS